MNDYLNCPTDLHNVTLYMEACSHFNKVVLDCVGGLRRLIGYGETGVDCYWIMQSMGGKVTWSSCVGGFISLDKLNNRDPINPDLNVWDDYRRLDNVLELNGAPKVDKMRVELMHDDMEMGNGYE